ncbi:MAG: ABC transporter ATP-binding protein [Acidimicrobiia bacterium]|nr:MAG: ABC transporter ATP-binding protein [Acidimicrobiia bacterium]
MPDTSFTTSQLGHAYGSVAALHSLDVTVPRGRTGLVGANGAGKSTLIKTLLGIITPTMGSATVLGMDTRHNKIDIRSVVGYMPEGPCFPLDQTAADFLVYAAGTAGLPRQSARQRASDVLTLVGLNEERFRYLGDYSTGMKQRAKLAQAIVHDPQLVFLDEPTAGLDPSGREEMLDLIGRLGSFGIDVVVSSHVLRDIERTCDFVMMLDSGTLLHAGPLGTRVDADIVHVELIDGAAAFERALITAGAEVEGTGNRMAVRCDDGDVFDLIRDSAARSGASLLSLGASGSSLEDMFLHYGNRP